MTGKSSGGDEAGGGMGFSMGKRAGCFLNIVLLIASLCLVVFAVEVILRLVQPEAHELIAENAIEPAHFLPDPGSSDQINVFDSRIGWRNNPGVSGQYSGPDGLLWKARINSRGIRDAEISAEPSPGVRRLILLGDSFAWGYGLREEQRLSEILENIIPGLEVVNLGLVGTSTDQQCLLLEEEGLGYRPDGVILLIHDTDIWHNSLSANYGRAKPHFVLGPAGLELRGVPVSLPPERTSATVEIGEEGETKKAGPGLKRFFYENSRLYRLVSSRLKRVGFLRRVLQDAGLAQAGPDSEHNVALTGAIVSRMRAASSAAGINDFVVVLIPSKELVCFHAGGYWIQAAELSRRERESSRLAQVLRRDGVTTVELAPEFIRRAREGETLYFREDNHWNARANELAAARLAALPEVSGEKTGEKKE